MVSIGVDSFYACYALDVINLPESFESFGEQAFDTTTITKINIPKKVRIIPKSLFYLCSKLKTVIVEEEGIVTFGPNAFSRCKSLKNFSLPKTTTTIEGSAFRYCSSLVSLVFPEKY